MAEAKKYPGKTVFGLDIGTRSIVGTVGYKNGKNFCVIAHRSIEHESRAMIDGQIHDIIKVGETISEVRKRLEEVTSMKLSEVAIAAAGRVLRTVNVSVEWPLIPEREVTNEDIYALASMGVEKAYLEFEKPEEQDGQHDTDTRFYCVGHSIVRFYLNGYQIGNLEGHKAKVIGADIIATFLPDDVVNSLHKAVEFAQLDIASLTLEPIAAIQLAIPERYRALNIALVDVGAGTSDISISKDGSIISYGMIAKAGDALTEEIAAHCLVDFATAEQIKHAAGEMDDISYSDIMFLPKTIKKKEVLSIVDETLHDMAAQAAALICELNGGKSVSAVFVVGGGGKIPGYTDILADELGIARERVALRGEEVMMDIIFEEEGMKKDSLLVTPVGICLNYYEQNNNFIFVSFNGQRLKIYDNNRLAVVDAAMQALFPNDALFPKRGKALNFQLGGTSRMVRGQPGEAAVISVNGDAADIYTPIHGNDVIVVKESTAGEAGRISIGEIKELNGILSIWINERVVELPRTAWVNGELQTPYYEIMEGDKVELATYYTVRQIAEYMDVVLEYGQDIYVNNKRADLDTPVYENFSVGWSLLETVFVEADEGETVETLPGDEVVTVAEDMEPPTMLTVVVNEDTVVLTGKSEYVFVDIFEFIDFDLINARGRNIITQLNGRAAQFMEPLKDGDAMEIYWNE